MIFVPLPGEYIASAVRRGNETLGIKGLNTLDYRIKKKPRPQGECGIESKIEYPKFLVDHQASISVLYENTLYPLAAALGRTVATCIYTPHTQLKICLQCVIDDLEENGTAFIHRNHLIYSVSLCNKHATPLHNVCPACLISITSHKISQFIECSASYKKESVHFSSPPHQYANFVNLLLHYDKNPLTTWGVEQTILKRMLEQNILEGLSIDTSILIRKTKETLGIDVRFELFRNLSMEICSIMAFFVYTHADAYFSDTSHLPTQNYL